MNSQTYSFYTGPSLTDIDKDFIDRVIEKFSEKNTKWFYSDYQDFLFGDKYFNLIIEDYLVCLHRLNTTIYENMSGYYISLRVNLLDKEKKIIRIICSYGNDSSETQDKLKNLWNFLMKEQPGKEEENRLGLIKEIMEKL